MSWVTTEICWYCHYSCCSKHLTSHACALLIDNVGNYLYIYLNNGSFKSEVDPHQFNLRERKKIFTSWQVCDWLAKWLIVLGFMDLRWPRVYRRSNVGLVWAYHQQLDCLLNNLFRPTTKKTPKLHITNPLWGESNDHRLIPSKGAIHADRFPYHDIITYSTSSISFFYLCPDDIYATRLFQYFSHGLFDEVFPENNLNFIHSGFPHIS